LNATGNKITVLVTTIPPEAKGGIVALHRVLFRQSIGQNHGLALFPVASPAPYKERLPARLYRVFVRAIDFSFLLLKDRSIKIVHVNSSPDSRAILRDSLFIMISWLMGKKIILQLHSTIDAYENPKVVEWIKKRMFTLCDKILVFSKNDGNKIKPMVPMEKIEIFPNAVNADDFKNKDWSFKRNLSIPEEGEIVLFLSRLFREKGVFDLIESIPEVIGEFEKVYFVFAGDGPDKPGMEEACKRKEIDKVVRFTGNLQEEDVRKAFSCADIFVLPSYTEGMPMAILQALAAGLPVIATPVGAIPDFIKDGINGFLVQPHSPGQLAEKLMLLLRDAGIRKKMADVNIQLAEKEFDVKVVSNRLEQLYEML
jgi:glycosyltransferase involved in cell wall biosynthesis